MRDEILSRRRFRVLRTKKKGGGGRGTFKKGANLPFLGRTHFQIFCSLITMVSTYFSRKAVRVYEVLKVLNIFFIVLI